ncbi:MAG TPA: hypothetical protein VHD37_01550 [Candidatus Paceibacterota bacterium]|nr:hypothetical protein [Candidatus Paceibacterota bacterium]
MLSARFFYLLFTGQILYYVNGRLLWLMVIGWALFGALSLRALRHTHGREPWYAYAVLIFLIVLPVRALDPAHALTISPQHDDHVSAQTLPADTSSFDFAAWYAYRNSGRPQPELEGKPFAASGFISDADLANKTLTLSRLVITCCIADAFQTSFTIAVGGVDTRALATGGWYAVSGTWHQSDAGVWAVAATAIESVPPPKDPYVYP